MQWPKQNMHTTVHCDLTMLLKYLSKWNIHAQEYAGEYEQLSKMIWWTNIRMPLSIQPGAQLQNCCPYKMKILTMACQKSSNKDDPCKGTFGRQIWDHLNQCKIKVEWWHRQMNGTDRWEGGLNIGSYQYYRCQRHKYLSTMAGLNIGSTSFYCLHTFSKQPANQVATLSITI